MPPLYITIGLQQISMSYIPEHISTPTFSCTDRVSIRSYKTDISMSDFENSRDFGAHDNIGDSPFNQETNLEGNTGMPFTHKSAYFPRIAWIILTISGGNKKLLGSNLYSCAHRFHHYHRGPRGNWRNQKDQKGNKKVKKKIERGPYLCEKKMQPERYQKKLHQHWGWLQNRTSGIHNYYEKNFEGETNLTGWGIKWAILKLNMQKWRSSRDKEDNCIEHLVTDGKSNVNHWKI